MLCKKYQTGTKNLDDVLTAGQTVGMKATEDFRELMGKKDQEL